MKAYELVEYLGNYPDESEVFIEDAEGTLHDFKCIERPPVFDGFDTAYEEGVSMVMID